MTMSLTLGIQSTTLSDVPWRLNRVVSCPDTKVETSSTCNGLSEVCDWATEPDSQEVLPR
jgi:hypothetical protein